MQAQARHSAFGMISWSSSTAEAMAGDAA